MPIDFKTKVQYVKEQVTIPKYFYEIIVPNMKDYYSNDSYLVDFDSKPVVKCPLHSEDTPSMRYYEETNTYYCFGCGSGGDIIQLHRNFLKKQLDNEVTFSQAVEFLYNYFIQKKTDTKISNKPVKIQPTYSKVDMARYNRYTGQLERALLSDRVTPLESKEAIWKALDLVSELLGVGEIGPTDGMEYIKSVVSNTIK